MNTVWRQLCVAAALAAAALVIGARPAGAQTLAPQERMCDPTFQDCRADILTYIAQENVEIDMGFWMMTDARYSNALVAAWQRGVKIRLLMDPRCVAQHENCGPQNDQLAGAGIPMRNRNTSGILHWKMVIFAGQGQVEFAGANYAPFEMAPETPWVNFTDEIVYYSNDPSIVHSMMTRFDDLWTSTTEFVDYANVTGPLTRSYPIYPIDPELNFPPDDSYRTRSINAYNAETQKMDVLMFRITDEQQSNAAIAAVNRGIPVRLITDTGEYRNPDRLWDAYNVDKMWQAGVQVRLDAHQGINHAKGILLYSQGLSIFGSSNWTSPSSDSQREHNYFTTKAWIFTWIQQLFDRKWNNTGQGTETEPFTPLPPDVPVYNTPANGATGQATTITLKWDAGLWAHLYDIYFGISPNPPLLVTNTRLGPSQFSGDYRSYTVPFALQPGTTYYWKIVSKTMAYKTAEGPVWSFTTAGTPPGTNQPPSVTLTSPANGATFNPGATITLSANASDADGNVIKVDFYSGSTLLGSSSAPPYSYTWNNVPAGNYSITAVATDNSFATTTSTPVSITVGTAPSGLPAGWAHQDIGATGAAGTTSYANGTFTVTGAGADIWGTADALQYAYRSMTGDGTVVARVATVGNTASWFKAGVMIRNNLTPGSAQATMLVSYAKGSAFQRRTTDGGGSLSTTGSTTATAPLWIKLTRAGNAITASQSTDGANWTVVGSDTVGLGATAYVGLAVSSHVSGTTGTATFDNVSVTQVTNSPPTVSLTTPADGSTYTAPASIGLTASASDSDGTIARVDFYSGSTLVGSATTAPYTTTWSNVGAGTYSLTAVATDDQGASTTSAPVSITVSTTSSNQLPSGWSHQDVGSTGAAGDATYSNGVFTVTGAGADIWGTADAFQYAYQSMTGDGTIVARVASVGSTASWFKAGVMIRNNLSAGSAQGLMLVSYAKGTAFQRRLADGNTTVSTTGSGSTAPRLVKLARSGNVITAYESADGTAWTLVGSDTFSMGSTVYVGLAVSSHVNGVLGTATFDSVSVTASGPVNSPPSASLTSPADGATAAAPAAFTLTASASDSDGTVASVAFYANSTLLGTVTTSPYTMTWSNVPAGSYALTAVATDDGGASTTSAAVNVTVTTGSSGSLPSGWNDQDIGAVPIAGSASFANNVFSVTGSGADIWGTADAFHYAYTQVTGDTTIVARVASVQNVATWVKAGVMIRESLTPGSTHAFMLVSASKGVAFQRRGTTDGTSLSTAGSLSTAPRWVKLVRAGDAFSAYESADGTTWTLVGTDTIAMGSTVYVGLAVTSHTTSASATATFDGVSMQ